MGSLLVALIVVPLAAAIVVLLLGDGRAALVRQVSLVTAIGCAAIVWDVSMEMEKPDVRQARDASPAAVVKPTLEFKYTWLNFRTEGEARAGGLQFHLGVD